MASEEIMKVTSYENGKDFVFSVPEDDSQIIEMAEKDRSCGAYVPFFPGAFNFWPKNPGIERRIGNFIIKLHESIKVPDILHYGILTASGKKVPLRIIREVNGTQWFLTPRNTLNSHYLKDVKTFSSKKK